MGQAKKVAVGLAMTAVSIAVIFFLVSKFAPASVKSYFQVA